MRRSVVSLVMAAVALVAAMGWGLLSVVNAAMAFAAAGEGRVWASIPLPEAAVVDTLAGSKGHADATSTVFSAVTVSGVPADITGGFVLAEAASTIVSLLLVVLVVVAALAMMTGRLRWGLLSWLTVAGGAFLAVGSILSQALSKTAAENLSIWMLSSGTDWLDPGFLAGIDFTVPVAGLVILVLGWAFYGSARYARDADGVV